jgi:hypothetical protein
MKSVEESPMWMKYCPLLPWSHTRPDILFTEEGQGYHVSDPRVDKRIYKVVLSTPRGGEGKEEGGMKEEG